MDLAIGCEKKSAQNMHYRFSPRGSCIEGVRKNREFRPISHFISETIREMVKLAIVATEDE